MTILRQPGNIHSECFRELAETVNAGLNALGHDSVIAEELSVPGRRSIVFGSNLIANLDAPVAFPGGSILYNLEQIYDGSPWLTPDLIAAFRAHTVWDYSRANIGALAAYGVTAQHVPVGYVPALSRISPSPAPDIDVLFIGSLAERRLGVLRALERQGARVVAIYGSYGPERDSVIARAKIVLNIHFHPAKVFEIVRVSYLLANRCFVVSETGSDAGIENAFAGGVAFADYDRLVDTCLAYLRDPVGRGQVASRGFAIMSSLGEADFLRPVVGEVGRLAQRVTRWKSGPLARCGRAARRDLSAVHGGVQGEGDPPSGASLPPPVPRLPLPVVAVLFPVSGDPLPAVMPHLPVAGLPDVLAPVPGPVAADPEVIRRRLRCHDFLARRRRRRPDVTSAAGGGARQPCSGTGAGAGRRRRGRSCPGGPVSGIEDPFAALVDPASLDPGLAGRRAAAPSGRRPRCAGRPPIARTRRPRRGAAMALRPAPRRAGPGEPYGRGTSAPCAVRAGIPVDPRAAPLFRGALLDVLRAALRGDLRAPAPAGRWPRRRRTAQR